MAGVFLTQEKTKIDATLKLKNRKNKNSLEISTNQGSIT